MFYNHSRGSALGYLFLLLTVFRVELVHADNGRGWATYECSDELSHARRGIMQLQAQQSPPDQLSRFYQGHVLFNQSGSGINDFVLFVDAGKRDSISERGINRICQINLSARDGSISHSGSLSTTLGSDSKCNLLVPNGMPVTLAAVSGLVDAGQASYLCTIRIFLPDQRRVR